MTDFIWICIAIVVLILAFMLTEASMTEEEKNDKTPVEYIDDNGPMYPIPRKDQIFEQRFYPILLALIVIGYVLYYLIIFIKYVLYSLIKLFFSCIWF